MVEPAPWTSLFNRIKATIPGAVDTNVKQELCAVLYDFTKETNVWVETIDIPIEPNVNTYPFNVTGGQPNRLMLVYDPEVGGYPRWADQQIAMPVPGVIQLSRTPSTAAQWKAVVAKHTIMPPAAPPPPSPPPNPVDYPAIDEWIVQKYQDALYFGTLAYLQRQPAKAYTDPSMSAFNSAHYRSAKGQARTEVMHMHTYNAQSWTFPQSWATVRRKGWA